MRKLGITPFRIVKSALLFIIVFSGVSGQDKKPVEIAGYITEMYSVMFDSLKGTILNDNLLHNRLNFKVFAGDHLSADVELRNRIFTGESVKYNPDYAELTGYDPGLADMSWNIVNEPSFLFNTTIDRLWIDLHYEKFQARIGRQRINWGQALVWNPNDIFNAYSFFDFDYVERPGSDAMRLQYFPSFTSSIELTVKSDCDERITAASLWRFNRWGYDIQFLAGYVNSEDYVLGAGWSGAIKNYSFRGEISWFQPARNFSDTSGRGLFTFGFDRIFSDNSMVQFQLMYCNDPLDMSDFRSFYYGTMSSKDLAFSELSVFGQYTYPISPIVSITMAGMWLPGLKGYFAGPSFDFSVAENFDFSFLWQRFKGQVGSETFKVNMGFMRFKYSF